MALLNLKHIDLSATIANCYYLFVCINSRNKGIAMPDWLNYYIA